MDGMTPYDEIPMVTVYKAEQVNTTYGRREIKKEDTWRGTQVRYIR